MTTSLIAAQATALALAQNALTTAHMSGTRALNALRSADKAVQYWSQAWDEATNQWDADYANLRYNLALDDQSTALAYVGQVQDEVNDHAEAILKARAALQALAEALGDEQALKARAALEACAEVLGDKQALLAAAQRRQA